MHLAPSVYMGIPEVCSLPIFVSGNQKDHDPHYENKTNHLLYPL